jgi:hypothetical protein
MNERKKIIHILSDNNLMQQDRKRRKNPIAEKLRDFKPLVNRVKINYNRSKEKKEIIEELHEWNSL